MHKNKWGIYLTLAVLVVVALFFFHPKKHTSTPMPISSTTTSTLPGLQTGTVPWEAEIAHLKERLATINLPALSAEGTALHTHQHIDISINGNNVQVPAGVGINERAGFISPIHVHDLTNIIHVESPTVQTFTLGQFFDIWGLQFTPTCIGGYCTDETKSLKVYVGGVLYQGDPRTIELVPHQEIYVFYGGSHQLPSTIPSKYDFPEGL